MQVRLAREMKESHTWSFPKGGVVVVELLECAQVRVAVVDELLEGGITNAADGLPVFARQMAHGAPAVHVLAVTSGDGCCKQRGEHEVLHGGENG